MNRLRAFDVWLFDAARLPLRRVIFGTVCTPLGAFLVWAVVTHR